MANQPSAGKTMRALRQGLQYSQAQVAEVAGVTEGAISQFETGRNAPSFATAKKIDAYLEADGSILDAYGYVAPSSPELRDQVTQMQNRLDEMAQAAVVDRPQEVELQKQLGFLVDRVTSLAATVHAQGAELERLRARLDRRDG